MSRFRSLPLLLLPALLTGCVSEGDFPSLAARPGEGVPLEEPVRAPVVVASDPALQAQISGLVGRAQTGDRAFEAAFARAAAAARRAGGRESDSWIEAQQAVSRVEAARLPTVNALVELDRLTTQRLGQPTSEADYQALAEAVEQVRAIADNQNARLGGLRAQLGG